MDPMDLGSEVVLTDDQIKALRYLMGLCPVEGYAFAYLQQWGVTSWTGGDPLQITDAASCMDCLVAFMNAGVWPGYLFERGEVWSHYILSVVPEQYHAAIRLLMGELGTPEDLMLYFRACYRFGHSVIPDQEYDALERLYSQTFQHMSFLTERSPEEDTLTYKVEEAIRLSGFHSSRSEVKRPVLDDSIAASLNAEKSTSVKPVRSYQEAYEFLVVSPRCRTHISLKADGINTKGILESKLTVALSRGRASDSWDFTEALNRVFVQQGINLEGLDGKITGESLVDPAYLPTLRDKYPGKEYKSPKSAAAAMLRAPDKFDLVDYQHLRFYPFEFAELAKDEAFKLFEEHGFSMLPYKQFEAGEIPLGSVEEFTEWIQKTLDYLWEEGERLGIGSDGVVLQLLDVADSDRADKYSDLNIAMKLSHWTEADYTSKVVEIEFTQRRVEMSCVLIVEPVTTRDLNVATRVSIGSPAILVADGVRVGDTISFTRKSEAINIYLGKVE